MKTREEAARDYWVNKLEMAEPKYVAFGAFEWFNKGHIAGCEWLESQASEGFDEWYASQYGTAWEAWQAAKLSSQKEIAEKDAEIEKLKQRIQELDYCQKAFYEATKKVGW